MFIIKIVQLYKLPTIEYLLHNNSNNALKSHNLYKVVQILSVFLRCLQILVLKLSKKFQQLYKVVQLVLHQKLVFLKSVLIVLQTRFVFKVHKSMTTYTNFVQSGTIKICTKNE